MRRISTESQRGNALVEYVILLMAVFLLVVAVLMSYGNSVQNAWAEADDNESAAEEVVSNLDHSPDPGEGCSAYYNAATGRWHDNESGLFISFDDASGMGCS